MVNEVGSDGARSVAADPVQRTHWSLFGEKLQLERVQALSRT